MVQNFVYSNIIVVEIVHTTYIVRSTCWL